MAMYKVSALMVILSLLTITLNEVDGLRTKRTTITCDFQTNLNTGGVKKFKRDDFVVAQGRYSEGKLPKKTMRYFADTLGITFARTTGDGPFSGSDLWKKDKISVSAMKAEGEKIMRPRFCTGCTEVTRKYIPADRILSDPANKMKAFINRERAQDYWYLGQYFKYFFDDSRGFFRPRIYECMNEPMVKWSRIRPGNQSEKEMIRRFASKCNKICKAVKKMHPEIKVGGPAAAFTRPYFQKFDYFRRRMQIWMDNMDGCQDFISEHLYDVGGAVAEGNIDLIESYTKKERGKVYDYVVSEMGSYTIGWYDKEKEKAQPATDGQDFKIMAEAMKVLHGLLRIPDKMLKAVSFITVDPAQRTRKGEPKYPWSMVVKQNNGQYKMTNLVRYFQMLQGVDGDFAYSYSSHPDVYVHAFLDGDKAWMIMQNLRNATVEVDFKFPKNLPAPLQTVKRKRLWLADRALTRADKNLSLDRGGKIMYEDRVVSQASSRGPARAPDTISIRHDEMVTYELTFAKKVSQTSGSVIKRSRHYNSKVLVPIEDEEQFFRFRNIPTGKGMGFIRIAHSRGWQRGDFPKITVNGVPVFYNPDVAGGPRTYHFLWFGVFIVAVDLDLLGRNPTIGVKYTDGYGGGTISTVTMQVDQCSGQACCFMGGVDGVTGEKPDFCATLFSGGNRPQPLPDKEQYPVGKEILRHGDFEARGSWLMAGGAYYQSKYAKKGRAAYLRQGGFVQQAVKLERGKTYRLTCDVVGDMVRFLVFGERTPVPFAKNYALAHYAGNKYFGEKQMDFDVPRNGNYFLRLLAADGRAAIDDCSLYRTSTSRPSGAPRVTPRPRAPSGWTSDGKSFFSSGNPPEATGKPKPTPKPTKKPTPKPTPKPTKKPTPKPTPKPTKKPTPKPTPKPTKKPTPKPTPKPTKKPTPKPTPKPTKKPTPKPTPKPTKKPTPKPTPKPTKKPTPKPTPKPTKKPTPRPTPKPTPTPKPGGSSGDGMIDGDFEKESRAWDLSAGANFENVAYSGKIGLHLENDKSTAVQTVELVKGRTYRFACAVTKMSTVLLMITRNGAVVARNDDPPNEELNRTWGEKILRFTPKVSGEFDLLIKAAAGVSGYADYCSLRTDSLRPKRQRSSSNLPDVTPATALSDGQFLRNPSFSNGERGWSTFGGAQFEKYISQDKDGYSMDLTSRGGFAVQVIVLRANRNYTLTCFVRTTAGELRIGVDSRVHGQRKRVLVSKSLASRGWRQVSLEFTTSNSVNPYGVFFQTRGGSSAYVDNCELV
ncbi:hypothetical protein NDN08_000603 [Rhodosorus marinus]|uniref:CBM6 domain-containing protein n=1 Tax=Rhodosorus marinus TaxID=101924 RepID=A0AAV8UPZ8_9RHOD|nr:hypothetical protein NDN08_000603 [Rhodosorus marinus]